MNGLLAASIIFVVMVGLVLLCLAYTAHLFGNKKK
jgi:hypothetical protein